MDMIKTQKSEIKGRLCKIYNNKRPLPMEEGFQMFPRAKMA